MQPGPDEFFMEVVKFLLDITCVHPKSNGMPKNKANFIVSFATYEGDKVDWGFLIGETLKVGILAL